MATLYDNLSEVDADTFYTTVAKYRYHATEVYDAPTKSRMNLWQQGDLLGSIVYLGPPGNMTKTFHLSNALPALPEA